MVVATIKSGACIYGSSKRLTRTDAWLSVMVPLARRAC